MSAGAGFNYIANAREQIEGSAASIYEDVNVSVVAIAVEIETTVSSQIIPNPGRENTSQSPQIEMGLGSGFVLDTEGHILTNAHAVAGATRIEVAFNDGTLARAEIVGLDIDSDLAVIRVEGLEGETLHPV